MRPLAALHTIKKCLDDGNILGAKLTAGIAIEYLERERGKRNAIRRDKRAYQKDRARRVAEYYAAKRALPLLDSTGAFISTIPATELQ